MQAVSGAVYLWLLLWVVAVLWFVRPFRKHTYFERDILGFEVFIMAAFSAIAACLSGMVFGIFFHVPSIATAVVVTTAGLWLLVRFGERVSFAPFKRVVTAALERRQTRTTKAEVKLAEQRQQLLLDPYGKYGLEEVERILERTGACRP